MNQFENDPDYEECIVSFLDILGFRSLIDELSAGEIRQRLEIFRHFSTPDESEKTSKYYGQGIFSDPGHEVVSDAVVRARPIRTEVRDGPLAQELIDLLCIQMQCVEHGIAVRGAVVIDHLHLGPNLEGPFFGPGLVKAYEIETSEVIFPRICIEETAIELLKSDASLLKEGHTLEIELQIIEDFVRTDDSGLYYIDYLKGAFHELENDYAAYSIFLEKHKNLIEAGLSNSSLPKHRRKYVWLKNFHNSRIDRLIEQTDPVAFVNEYECFIDEAFGQLRIE